MINDCPHCKAKNAILVLLISKVNNGCISDKAYVVCETCEMRGPTFFDDKAKEIAVAAWNKLSYEH